MIRLHEAQENYKNACRQSKATSSSKMAAKVGDVKTQQQQQQRTDDDGSVLASPVDVSAKTLGDPRGPPLRPAPSSRIGRVRRAYPFSREEEEGAEEEGKEGAEGEQRYRSKQKNRSSSSDAMTEIGAGLCEDVQLPRTSLSSVSRRISDPLRRHLTPGFEGDDGSPGQGSDRSSSTSVFGGPTTHVVLVTVHAAEGSATPSSSTLHRIEVQPEGEEGVGVSRRGFCRSSPDRAGGARGIALQKAVKHHSSLKVRRKGAMKAIQEKSQSFDAIQI